MKLSKKQINEHAKDYVWGVKNPERAGNKYLIKPVKKPTKEKKANG